MFRFRDIIEREDISRTVSVDGLFARSSEQRIWIHVVKIFEPKEFEKYKTDDFISSLVFYSTGSTQDGFDRLGSAIPNTRNLVICDWGRRIAEAPNFIAFPPEGMPKR